MIFIDTISIVKSKIFAVNNDEEISARLICSDIESNPNDLEKKVIDEVLGLEKK